MQNSFYIHRDSLVSNMNEFKAVRRVNLVAWDSRWVYFYWLWPKSEDSIRVAKASPIVFPPNLSHRGGSGGSDTSVTGNDATSQAHLSDTEWHGILHSPNTSVVCTTAYWIFRSHFYQIILCYVRLLLVWEGWAVWPVKRMKGKIMNGLLEWHQKVERLIKYRVNHSHEYPL